MKQRIVTGTVLIVLLGLITYFGEDKLTFLFSGLCVLLATGASYEFTKMSRKGSPFRWFDFVGIVLTFALLLMSVLTFQLAVGFYIYFFLYFITVILIYSLLFVIVKDFTKSDFGNQILTILYSSLGFVAFAYLRSRTSIGLELIIYLFLVTMITDTFAYFIGIRFGKHRLAEHISPKKSIEGAIGGLVFGALAATFFAYYTNVFEFGFVWIVLLSSFLSAIAQVGDLIASKFKREADIKDYSNIFPGHGGILDRFDSSMFAAIFLMIVFIFL